MARFDGAARITGEPVAAATAETLVQIVAVANHRVALTGYGVGSRGTSNTEAPGVIDLIRQTSAGTSSALTTRAKQATLSETLLTTALEDFTVEPTDGGDIPRTHTLHPQAAFDIRDAFSREIILGGSERFGIRADFADAQVLDAYMDFEE